MSYRDNSGIEHESYEAACIYYGADTPAMLAAEAAAEQREAEAEAERERDAIAAWEPDPDYEGLNLADGDELQAMRGGFYTARADGGLRYIPPIGDDEIPF